VPKEAQSPRIHSGKAKKYPRLRRFVHGKDEVLYSTANLKSLFHIILVVGVLAYA
jgi:hypothetical protein